MIRCGICGLSVPCDTISNITTSICETTSGVCYELETGGINVCRECIQALKGGFDDIKFKLREAQKDEYNYTGTYREDEGV
jgi:hypothetical protein